MSTPLYSTQIPRAHPGRTNIDMKIPPCVDHVPSKTFFLDGRSSKRLYPHWWYLYLLSVSIISPYIPVYRPIAKLITFAGYPARSKHIWNHQPVVLPVSIYPISQLYPSIIHYIISCKITSLDTYIAINTLRWTWLAGKSTIHRWCSFKNLHVFHVRGFFHGFPIYLGKL